MFGVTRKPTLSPLWRVTVSDHVIAMTWSPDGKHLAVAAVSGPITVIDAASGRVNHTLPGHHFGTTSVVWIDSSTVASGGQDGSVRLWDIQTGVNRLTLEAGSKWVERLAVSPCGTYFASAAGKTVRIWDPAGGLIRDFSNHASTVTDIVWKPSGLELTSSSYGGVLMWSPSCDIPVRQFEWKGSVLRLAWSADGQFLATGDQDSTVHFWIDATGQDLHMFGYPMKVQHLAWDERSQFLATGGGFQVTVWDCSGDGPEGTMPLSLKSHASSATITALAFQRKGPLLVSGGSDGKLVLWRPEKDKRPVYEVKQDSGITQTVWSNGDDRLAVGGESGEVILYQI